MTTTYRFADVECPFVPWRAEMGQVFKAAYALDTETTLIDTGRHWETPSYILGAACDGEKGFFLPADRVLAFLQAHCQVPVVFHNAVFDLKVLDKLAAQQKPDLDVYDLVEQNRVWDTMLMHRLYCLGAEGHTALGKGRSTLEACVKEYLGAPLPKDTKDAAGNDVRTSFGQYLNGDLRKIEPIYLEYLALDTLATVLVFDELVDHMLGLLETSEDAWGYVSADWLDEQIARWGPQTHHIQLKAAIVLDAITANGIGVNVKDTDELVQVFKTVIAEKEAALAAEGYQSGEGSAKVLQEMIRKAAITYPDLSPPQTGKKKKFSTAAEHLRPLAACKPFFRDYLDYKAASKLLTTYVGKMAKDRLHPRFDVLKTTGRTSSFGDINAQNLPRDDHIRRCFVPAEGSVFLNADYSTIEMATLAQSVLRQFGGTSCMADAINAGKDLHKLVAAKVTGKEESEVTKEERSKAKPINFGKPGGMGANRLRDYAQMSYGIPLTEEEVANLEHAWFDLFPEMRGFLDDECDTGLELARRLQLTPAEFNKALAQPARSGSGDKEPGGWLGGMCLKVLRDRRPATGRGREYNDGELAYFWDKAQVLAEDLKPDLQQALTNREPSEKLHKAVRDELGKAPVFTLTGRLRDSASYCARHNTVFQGLAADGAKLALWRLWWAGYRIVNFVHDEVLLEIPEEANLHVTAGDVERIMIQSMQEVVPDVAVKVEWNYRRCWSKAKEDQIPLPVDSGERELAVAEACEPLACV